MLTPKILTTLPQSTPKSVLADLLAGITVAMVALPLSLAIAIASGAPPATGLVTAIVAGFLISALGGSRVQIGGPTGAFIVVVHAVILEHGLGRVILATLMAGVILVIAGLLRAGRLIRLVPEPVINGFTIGIAAIIRAQPAARCRRYHPAARNPCRTLERVPAIWQARGTLHGPASPWPVGTHSRHCLAAQRLSAVSGAYRRRGRGLGRGGVFDLCRRHAGGAVRRAPRDPSLAHDPRDERGTAGRATALGADHRVSRGGGIAPLRHGRRPDGRGPPQAQRPRSWRRVWPISARR